MVDTEWVLLYNNPCRSPKRFRVGSIAQLGEHLPYKQGVTGSSPVPPTKSTICWRGSTVEQLICNQQVGGSIPSASSIKKIEGFPSGQRGWTVNPLAELSMVRIHLPRPICGSGSGVEHRLAKARVASSNLVFRSIFIFWKIQQSRAKQSKAKQSKAKQSKAKQSKAKD